MRSGKPLPLFVVLVGVGFLAGCGGGGGDKGGGSNSSPFSISSSSSITSPASSCSAPQAITLPNGSSLGTVSGNNVMTLTVDGSTCNPATVSAYPNKPCVSVRICSGGMCETINDILLDTGDYGLRIFKDPINNVNPALYSALTSAGNSVEVNGQPLYECVEYGDGSSVWGPVVLATLTLGGEPSISVPIQLIGTGASDNESGGAHACSGQLSSPTDAMYNGSLGVGFLAHDCGTYCAATANNGQYYTCSGGTCSGAEVSSTNQVGNPVASLSEDYNGVVASLPSVSSNGSASVEGFLIFGIGTEANNSPAASVTPYGADQSTLYLATAFDSGSYQGFLDTGSNGIFFNYPTTNDNGFYTPPCTLSFSATNTGASNAPNSGQVLFNIANADALFVTGNNVFSNLGGTMPNDQFDWGLPFFLGRNVYVGIEGQSSTFSSGSVTGPFWAY